MKILILTQAEDSHTVAVQLALEDMGHQVQLLFSADQPTKLTHSARINNRRYEWKSLNQDSACSDNDYEVVWWRRPRKPYVPQPAIHPEDYLFALRENNLFYESITSNIAPTAWWINPKSAATQANYKLLQLMKAKDCGVLIPETLLSNNAQDIRDFLAEHEQEGVIYKPFCSNTWFEDSQIKFGYTSKITVADLADPHFLQLVPGIFQKEIKKSFELRITCFGDYMVAAKLNSQLHPKGSTDWRAIPHGKMEIEPYSLPVVLQEKIRSFMNSMGLVFGALDFIVTEQQDYIFLEVNEQGQFLWLEDANPQFSVLDIFLRFITHQSSRYEWTPPKHLYRLSEYLKRAKPILMNNRERHVCANTASIPHAQPRLTQATGIR